MPWHEAMSLLKCPSYPELFESIPVAPTHYRLIRSQTAQTRNWLRTLTFPNISRKLVTAVTATKVPWKLGIGIDRGTTLMVQEEVKTCQDEATAHHASSGYHWLILVQYISISIHFNTASRCEMMRVGCPWRFPPPPLLVASLIWIHLLRSPAEVQRIFKRTLYTILTYFDRS